MILIANKLTRRDDTVDKLADENTLRASTLARVCSQARIIAPFYPSLTAKTRWVETEERLEPASKSSLSEDLLVGGRHRNWCCGAP
ncbi:hypothetical protein CEXT_547901 [Caerostris extrusa]|uniref:Uncharacterized protein n=1 Tax=Caerostris extrusa TaxID=172846 RepID=A0AAV4NXA8_CAEEX|nr:hypothetical protein CEXT_547901 [Caerostris extrusa]